MANPEVVKQFGGKLLNIYTGGVLTKLIEVGYQVGLFEASKRGPATSDELSERAGLKERYVREWLGAEFKFSSRVEDNIKNPFAPMYYGISLMHCMPVSLALGGKGLGTVWGEQTARQYLAETGFRTVKVVDAPRPQNCIFVCGN